jgi:hypothetical protein
MVTWQLMGTACRGLAVLALIVSAAPAARAAETTTVVADQPFELAEGEIEGVSGLFHEISRMPPEKIVLIGATAAGSAYLATLYLGSGIYAIIAAVLGAAMAEHLYDGGERTFSLY